MVWLANPSLTSQTGLTNGWFNELGERASGSLTEHDEIRAIDGPRSQDPAWDRLKPNVAVRL